MREGLASYSVWLLFTDIITSNLTSLQHIGSVHKLCYFSCEVLVQDHNISSGHIMSDLRAETGNLVPSSRCPELSFLISFS